MLFRKLIISFLVLLPILVTAQTVFGWKLAKAAGELTKKKVTYNDAYFSIDYPNGDVPGGYGVCTDLIVRAYRALNIDLQEEVHQDMKAHFQSYPQN